jgi:hypothetical protein
MSSNNQNFNLFKGEDKGLLFTIRDSNGDLFDLTGSTAEWILSRNNISSPSIKKTTTAGITFPSPESGLMLVSLLATDTQNLWGQYYHEAAITDTSGNRKVVAYGDNVKINYSPTFTY